MNSSSDSKQISSKEILARTGISRATLNNYIGLNLIPPPTVRKPKEGGGPTKIGYFPEWVVDRHFVESLPCLIQCKTLTIKASECIELGIEAPRHYELNPKMVKPTMEKTKALRANVTEG